MKRTLRAVFAAAALLALGLAPAACNNHSSDSPDAPVTPHADARPADANLQPDGAPGPDASCFTNPTTHNQIINACTGADVTKVDKRPVLTGLADDGGLPQLP